VVKSRYAISMPSFDIDALSRLAARLTDTTQLTPAERSELLRIAQGFACKDSAAAAEVSPETIRARRKRIYRKLGVAGAGEVVSALLALSLDELAGRGAARAPIAPAANAAAQGLR
jgi:DNA-binding CsgD family transcriptional regulator